MKSNKTHQQKEPVNESFFFESKNFMEKVLLIEIIFLVLCPIFMFLTHEKSFISNGIWIWWFSIGVSILTFVISFFVGLVELSSKVILKSIFFIIIILIVGCASCAVSFSI